MKLNLEAKSDSEKRVLEHLEKNASDVLAEKINAGKKTMAQCWSYIVAEAKKRAKNGCACIDDATVFGWAIHFFEEDSIESKTYSTSNVVVAPAKKKKREEEEKKSVEKKKDAPKVKKSAPTYLEENQFSLF